MFGCLESRANKWGQRWLECFEHSARIIPIFALRTSCVSIRLELWKYPFTVRRLLRVAILGVRPDSETVGEGP